MNLRDIQDYSQRLQRNDPAEAVRKLQSANAKIGDSSGSKTFEEQLQSALENAGEGKISSSSVTIPRDIQTEIQKDPYRKKLYDASVEFESMFVGMMLDQMRKSVQKSGLIDGGYAEEIFEDMLYDEYSKSLSANTRLGLAEQIYDTMSQSLPSLTKESEKK